MIKFGDVLTFGWEAAIRGMRNSYASWNKSDSGFCGKDFKGDDIFVVGPNDMKLAWALAKAGGSEAKFRRMIHVQFDIWAPMYWWKEWDTYKVGTVRNSTSTMHSIMNSPFALSDFSHEHLVSFSLDSLISTIDILNHFRTVYYTVGIDAEKKKEYWEQIIQLLPSSYNQLATVDLNYEVLAHMVHDRQNHKLDEWKDFCKFIRNECPYSKQLIFCEAEDDKRCGSCETGSEEVESQRTDDVSNACVSNE